MGDNVAIPATGAGTALTDEMTLNGVTGHVQLIRHQGGDIVDGGVSVTTTPIPIFGSSLECSSVIMQAAPSNTDSIYWGDSVSQNMSIEIGQIFIIAVKDVQKIWVRSNSGTQILTWVAAVRTS